MCRGGDTSVRSGVTRGGATTTVRGAVTSACVGVGPASV